jgi:hypothetical protein
MPAIFLGANTKTRKTTPCTVEGSLIDKGFSERVATTFVTVITLTRRAKHWHDAIVPAVGDKGAFSSCATFVS